MLACASEYICIYIHNIPVRQRACISLYAETKCSESSMKVYLVNCFESIFLFFESLPVHFPVLIIQF